MNKRWYMAGSICLTLSLAVTSFAATPSYLTQSEYTDVLYDNTTEDRGIVVENQPQLGYLVYKNSKGQVLTRQYYASEIQVEKQPYGEEEDRIGYLDELFPNFAYDPRDTDIESIQAGDCIYIKMNGKQEITYLSAYNDYIMRYGKVISFQYNTGDAVSLQLEDEKGSVWYYEVPIDTPVTKGHKPCSLSTVKAGDWVKVLVSQKILGEGIIEEAVQEIVVDHNTRIISQVYRGQVASLDSFKGLLNMKNAQALGSKSWGRVMSLLPLGIDERTATLYQNGNRISSSYLKRYLTGAEGYVYVAAEQYKGKESAVKLNFQSSYQKTLPSSPILSVTPSTVHLLSGEVLTIGADTLLVREKRLVDASSLMPGDKLQAVVTAGNKLAVGKVSTAQATEGLSIYRGRIKKIAEREYFEVETFSMLEGETWYYYPTPQTFSLSPETQFYNETGLIVGGLDSFLSYGPESHGGDVYTIIASGTQAQAVIAMPYVTQAVRGEVYGTDGTTVRLKDVYYYDTVRKKWMLYSNKNMGATITLGGHTVLIKEGKRIPASKLAPGDTVRVMTETSLKGSQGTVTGAILVVEN